MSAVNLEIPPGGWENKRFRYLAEVEKGRLPTPQDTTKDGAQMVPYLSMEYLRGEISEPTLVPLESGLLLADEGDILLLWDGSNAGEFLRAKSGVVASTAARVAPKGVDRRFFYWRAKAQRLPSGPKQSEWASLMSTGNS